MSKNIAIVIPVYNEVKAIEKVLRQIIENKSHADQIILVEDGSNDGTELVINSWEKSCFCKDNNITILHNEKNSGYGYTLFKGMKYATENTSAEFILTMDCDEQHEAIDIPRFKLHTEYDLISGSRYLANNEKGIAAPADRPVINQKIVQKLNKFACTEIKENWNLTDSFCGMKLYKKKLLKEFVDVFLSLPGHGEYFGYGFPLIFWKFYILWLKNNNKNLQSSFTEESIARIYISNTRSFGKELDQPLKRYRYYLKCFQVPIKL